MANPPEQLMELEWQRLELAAREEALRLAHDFYYNPKFTPQNGSTYYGSSAATNMVIRSAEVLALAKVYYEFLKPSRPATGGTGFGVAF